MHKLETRFFRVLYYRVVTERSTANHKPVIDMSEATMKVKILADDVVRTHVEHTVSEGKGPVDALYKALCKAFLEDFDPGIANWRLLDYEVHKIGEVKTTAAQVKVVIKFINGVKKPGNGVTEQTVEGVSDNIIEASLVAIVKYFGDEFERTHSRTL